jgi:hypothetical protein
VHDYYDFWSVWLVVERLCMLCKRYNAHLVSVYRSNIHEYSLFHHMYCIVYPYYASLSSKWREVIRYDKDIEKAGRPCPSHYYLLFSRQTIAKYFLFAPRYSMYTQDFIDFSHGEYKKISIKIANPCYSVLYMKSIDFSHGE